MHSLTWITGKNGGDESIKTATGETQQARRLLSAYVPFTSGVRFKT